MALAHRAQTQDEAHPTRGCAGLVRMRHDAGIEQRRGLEGVFMQEIGADQPALLLAEAHMLDQRLFHFIGARLECVEQIAMTTLEILEHFGKVRVH